MKPSLTLSFAYLLVSTLVQSAPIGLPPLSAEASLTDSVRSFESAWSQLDEKVQAAVQKKDSFRRKEIALTGAAAGASLLATGGFVASAALPRVFEHRKEEQVRKLHEAAARARSSQRKDRIKRAIPMEGVEGMEGEGDSFVSALSRSNSERFGDFQEHPAKSVHLVDQHGKPYLPPSRLAIDRSPNFELFSPRTPAHPGGSTHDRLAAVEQALLEIKQHQHDAAKLSPFTKALIGVGVVDAAATLVAAELNVQNAVEAGKSKKSEEEEKEEEEDVKRLDKKSCEEFKSRIPGLDCSKAHS